METRRLFPLSGIAFVTLVVVSLLVGGNTPGTDTSANDISSFYEANEVRQFVVCFALAATVPFLVFFAVALTEAAGRSPWGHVTIAGAILAGGAILVTALIHFALADVAANDASADAVSALNALDGSTWVAFDAGFGVMMLGAAGLLLSAGVMRWLGWIALVLGVAAFIPVADFVALLGTLIWIVVVSVLQARAPKTTHAASPAPAR